MNMIQERVLTAHLWPSTLWHTSFMKLIILYLLSLFFQIVTKKIPLYWLLFFLKGSITFVLEKECIVVVILKQTCYPYLRIFTAWYNTTRFPTPLPLPPESQTGGPLQAIELENLDLWRAPIQHPSLLYAIYITQNPLSFAVNHAPSARW